MRNIINRVFSNKYVNHAAVEGNIVLLLMYRFAYPFAALLNKLHFSPNQITTQSLLCSIFAFVSLVFDQGWVWFSIFWGLSVLLDFCDGTVARMASKVSKMAFRYDHMSDLFKISLIMLGVGIHYNEIVIWGLAFSASFVLLYCDALNQTLGNFVKLAAQRQNASTSGSASEVSHSRLRERSRFIAWIVKYDWLMTGYKNIHAAILTVNGHTLLLFFIFPLGRTFAVTAFTYLILIELLAIRARIITLVAMRR